MRLRWRSLLIGLLMILTCIGAFPIAIKIADPRFTFPFDPTYFKPVLLVWPDHVEIRAVERISEVSPRPNGESYTFFVPPERTQWVQEEIRKLPQPGPKSAWYLRVKQISRDWQVIDLEAFGDGFCGMVYEARPTWIVPMQTRNANPGAAFVYLRIDMTICCIIWGLVWLATWIMRSQARHKMLIAKESCN